MNMTHYSHKKRKYKNNRTRNTAVQHSKDMS